MKKKKRQLVGGILLMVLGLGVCAGSVAFRYFERGGLGPFNAGHKIVNRHGMNGNYGFNKAPNFGNRKQNNQNQNNKNGSQTPTPPSDQNQAPK